MTRPETPDSTDGGGWFEPSVEIWIDDTTDGQSLFVTTTDRHGHHQMAALWQPTTPDPRNEETP